MASHNLPRCISSTAEEEKHEGEGGNGMVDGRWSMFDMVTHTIDPFSIPYIQTERVLKPLFPSLPFSFSSLLFSLLFLPLLCICLFVSLLCICVFFVQYSPPIILFPLSLHPDTPFFLVFSPSFFSRPLLLSSFFSSLLLSFFLLFSSFLTSVLLHSTSHHIYRRC